ncbi:MAG: hypothetical protein ACRBHB_04380 [Arenicella sp.]
MSKPNIIIWAPVALGIVLLVVTKIDLYQFQNQAIDVQSMLLREIPIVILGLLLSAGVLLSSIYWFIKKQWLVAVQAIVSPLLFMLFFGIGGSMGGAFLNAT